MRSPCLPRPEPALTPTSAPSPSTSPWTQGRYPARNHGARSRNRESAVDGPARPQPRCRREGVKRNERVGLAEPPMEGVNSVKDLFMEPTAVVPTGAMTDASDPEQPLLIQGHGRAAHLSSVPRSLHRRRSRQLLSVSCARSSWSLDPSDLARTQVYSRIGRHHRHVSISTRPSNERARHGPSS